MSILQQLRKSAQNAAREGLEKLGLTLSVPKVDLDDEEDTKSRDIIDIYCDLFEKSPTLEPIPVPAEFHSEFKAIAEQLCAKNSSLLDVIDAWLEDRRTANAKIEDPRDLSKKSLLNELISVLKHLGVIAQVADSHDDWLASAQSIAQIQNKPIFNLLLQADKQIESSSFSEWKMIMNEKISRFGHSIVQLTPEYFTISEREITITE